MHRSCKTSVPPYAFCEQCPELASEQLDEERRVRRRRESISSGGKRYRSRRDSRSPESPISQHLFSASTAIMSPEGSLRSPTLLDGEPPRQLRPESIHSAASADASPVQTGGKGVLEVTPSKTSLPGPPPRSHHTASVQEA